MPSLRIAFVVWPEELADRINAFMNDGDIYSVDSLKVFSRFCLVLDSGADSLCRISSEQMEADLLSLRPRSIKSLDD